MNGTLNWLMEDEPWHPGWKPSPQILAWFRGFLRLMSEGAVWDVPGTGCQYKISHKNKTMTLVSGNPNDSKHWHDKNRAVMAELGWIVLDRDVPPSNPNEISLTASAARMVCDLLEDGAEDPFTKSSVTLQYSPFQHKDKWMWHWVLLPQDKSKALEHGSADSRAQAAVAARQAARKLGVVIDAVSVISQQ